MAADRPAPAAACVRLTALEVRLLLGMLTNPAYRSFEDYAEVVEPLRVKLEAVL